VLRYIARHAGESSSSLEEGEGGREEGELSFDTAVAEISRCFVRRPEVVLDILSLGYVERQRDVPVPMMNSLLCTAIALEDGPLVEFIYRLITQPTVETFRAVLRYCALNHAKQPDVIRSLFDHALLACSSFAFDPQILHHRLAYQASTSASPRDVQDALFFTLRAIHDGRPLPLPTLQHLLGSLISRGDLTEADQLFLALGPDLRNALADHSQLLIKPHSRRIGE
jgi:hypothetical protein